MATVKFNLKESTTDKETLIYCIFRFNNQKLKYSTGEKVHPDSWNYKTQRTFESIKEIESLENLEHEKKKKLREQFKSNSSQKEINESINTQLNRYKEQVEKIETQQKKLNEPLTIEILKAGLDKEFKKNTEGTSDKKEQITLIPFIQNYKDTVKLTNDTNHNQISDLTKKKYQTLVNLLTGYIEKREKKELKFENIDLVFFNDFVDYLQTEKKHATNTLNKYITTLKMFISLADENSDKLGITVNPNYRSKFFQVSRVPTFKIYLSQSELNTLFNLDLSENMKLDKVRDLFLIGCNTALRYSDYTNIKKGNIYTNDEGSEMLKITAYKGGETLDVPANYMVKHILSKYDYKLPEQISNQKTNDYLKELGELAGINREIIDTKRIGGKQETKTNLKYELISTHTARRTGATLMYLAGIPALSIMKITGHKTERSFLGYIRITSEENATLISKNKFFSTDEPKMGKVINM